MKPPKPIRKKSPKKHWYIQCGEVILEMVDRGIPIGDAYEGVNKILKILEGHGFLDSDWWCEIEPDDPRYGK